MKLFSPQASCRSLRRGLLLALTATFCLAGCGSSSENARRAGSSSSPDAGAISLKLDAAQGTLQRLDAVSHAPLVDGGQADSQAPPNTTCSLRNSTLFPRPAEVLLVLDRSATMADAIAADGTSKWNATVAAVESSVRASQEVTAWGLMLFPKSSGDMACCQMAANDLAPAVEVVPATESTQAIGATLAQSVPTGIGTPTARALVQAANFLLARTTSTSKYIVLATGGEPTCTSDGGCDGTSTLDYARTKDTVAHVASVLGIPVAVAGIALPATNGNLQPNSRQQLFSDMANLGGMPNTTPGQPAYYPANSAADLVTALGRLGVQATSCSFALPDPVAWPDNVAVLLSENRIARDTTHQDGWDFGDGNTSVVLFGKSCDDARRMHGLATLQFVTACPDVPVTALGRRDWL
jgi:hypothetical protein